MTRQDVFISYAHVDNEALLEDQEGWISILQRALQKRLSQLLGRVATVWLDRRRLAGNYYFDDTIANACEGASVMVSVVTPRYLKSEYCRLEVDHFEATHELKVGDRSCLFTCIKTPVARDELFPQMAGKLGYEFYRAAEQMERFREYTVYDPELKPQFMMALEDMAQDICRLLALLESRPLTERPRLVQGAPQQVQVLASTTVQPVLLPPANAGLALASAPPSSASLAAPAPAPRVFVASCSGDVRSVRDGIVRVLAGRQAIVTPAQSWSESAAEFERELREAVADASLSVHILGSGYGTIPEDAEASYPVLQFERVRQLAAERAKDAPLARLLWLPRELQASSEKQRKFLEQVRSDASLGALDELLEGSEEELKERVLAKLEALDKLRREREERARRASQPSERPTRGASSPPPMLGPVKKVYVISSEVDPPEPVMQVERILDEHGFDVISSVELLEEESEAAREAQHQAWLAQCDGCLIYHGNTKVSWVRAQIDEVRKVTGRRVQGPITGHAIYVAPPLEALKLRYQVHFPKLEGRADPQGDLQPFILQMQESELAQEPGAALSVVDP